jgi:hypothetical protein
MKENQPYKPVACGFHDRLLDYATLRKPVQVKYLDESEQMQEFESVILDVFTANGAEFIQFKNGIEFRLDALLEVDGFHTDGSCKI